MAHADLTSARLPVTPEYYEQQFDYLMHASICQQRDILTGGKWQCTLPYCTGAKSILDHAKDCQVEENCTVPHCSASKRIINHWKSMNQCNQSTCSLCIPTIREIRHAVRSNKDLQDHWTRNLEDLPPNQLRSMALQGMSDSMDIDKPQQEDMGINMNPMPVTVVASKFTGVASLMDTISMMDGQEVGMAAQQAQPPSLAQPRSGVDPIGGQPDLQQAMQGQMAGTGILLGAMSSLDPHNYGLILSQFVQLLRDCRCPPCQGQTIGEVKRIRVRGCLTVKDVEYHIKKCYPGMNCTVLHCNLVCQLVYHYKNCKQSDCPVCSRRRDRANKANSAQGNQSTLQPDHCMDQDISSFFSHLNLE